MTAEIHQINITADGTYDLDNPSTATEIIASGDFGGGTLTLSVINPIDGVAVAVVGGSWTDDFTDVHYGDNRRQLRFILAGSSSPNINIVLGRAE